MALSGCAGVISKEVRSEAEPLASFAELRDAPERFQGKTVILGGEIIETRNRADATTLVVLEKPLDSSDRPKDTDASGGRFLARFSEYLDPVVFGEGRKITIAGAVVGVETENVGRAPTGTLCSADGRRTCGPGIRRAPGLLRAPLVRPLVPVALRPVLGPAPLVVGTVRRDRVLPPSRLFPPAAGLDRPPSTGPPKLKNLASRR